eukprot:5102975-Alexandrium_andersonii.AAC.1
MSASLVGSEMCIRDRAARACVVRVRLAPPSCAAPLVWERRIGPALITSVSYTHLTLPTICSV